MRVVRAVKPRFAIGADEPDDERIKRILLAREGAVDPSPEVLHSISAEAVSRERDRLRAEAVQEVERRKAESPEGQIAAAREADQAREEQAELVGLAQRQLGLSDEDVADLGPHRVLRKAGFVEVTADDLPKLDADEADEWLLAHPDEMNRLMEKAAGEHLLSKWNGLPAVDRAREAALVDTTVEAVEAELSRRGIEFSSIADHVAARQVFEEVKGGDES